MLEPEEDGDLGEEGLYRRTILWKISLVAIGVSAALTGGSSLLGSVWKRSSNYSTPSNESTRTTSMFSTSMTRSATNPGGSAVTIKVVYFGLPGQITETKQEHLTLKSPVYLSSVISAVTQRHAALISMIGAMQILVNGNPVEPDQELSDRDELDFIPIQAGG